MAEKKKPLTDKEKSICANLRRIWDAKKNELGLSQQKAAEYLGITQGAVSHQLGGRNALHTDAIIAWSALLKCSPFDIDPDRAYLSGRSGQDTAQEDQQIYETLRRLSPEKRRTGIALLKALTDQEESR